MYPCKFSYEWANVKGCHWSTAITMEVADNCEACKILYAEVKAKHLQGAVAISAGWSALNRDEIALLKK